MFHNCSCRYGGADQRPFEPATAGRLHRIPMCVRSGSAVGDSRNHPLLAVEATALDHHLADLRATHAVQRVWGDQPKGVMEHE